MVPGGLCMRGAQAGERCPLGTWAPSWDTVLQPWRRTNVTACAKGSRLSSVFLKANMVKILTATNYCKEFNLSPLNKLLCCGAF